MRIITGKVGGAGVNDLNIYLRLIGNKGCTGKLHIEDLKQSFEDGLKPNTHMDMMIATDDSLGDIQVVILGIDGMLADLHTWFVDFTVVYDFLKSNDADREIQFPCYHWISGDSMLPLLHVQVRRARIILAAMLSLYFFSNNSYSQGCAGK